MVYVLSSRLDLMSVVLVVIWVIVQVRVEPGMHRGVLRVTSHNNCPTTVPRSRTYPLYTSVAWNVYRSAGGNHGWRDEGSMCRVTNDRRANNKDRFSLVPWFLDVPAVAVPIFSSFLWHSNMRAHCDVQIFDLETVN